MQNDFRWLLQVIGSCTNEWQLDTCNQLINLFTVKYLYSEGMMSDRFSLLDAINKKNGEFIMLPKINEIS